MEMSKRNTNFLMIFSVNEKVKSIQFCLAVGGGFGGKKESGQLRFGGRDRPFRRPM